MEEVYVVRHRHFVERTPIRQIAREMGIDRNTVRRYLRGAPAGVGKPRGVEGAPVHDAVRPRAEAILEDSKRWTAGKQRLTAARLHELLRGEGFDVGYTVVKDIVREWKRKRKEVFVPLVYKAGDLAEVDFFEVFVDVGGERRKAHMFVMRVMHSGRDFAWLYPRQDQTCFLDGHVRAFAHLGGVPHRIVYDNLKAAVRKMLVGSDRELTVRFLSLATHYVFEPCFARPREGHDKGGVESRGKAIRWQELVPIPSGLDLTTIATALLSRLDARATERFEEDRAAMLPLPTTPFVAERCLPQVSVSSRSLAKVESASYSVWSTWARTVVTAYVGIDEVRLVARDDKRVVVHPRQPFGGRAVDYRHFIRELARKPQALRQVADELIAALDEPFAAAWRLLVDQHGPKKAARLFAQVLRAIEDRGEREVANDIVAALATGEPIQLAVRTRHQTSAALPAASLPSSLASLEVQAGVAADYDELLGGVS
ncbi:MAG: IS21 family transposase [Deltaproteobacteria bacterium]|nr:IS21 family transposase [Deltaproteobacteria bacterium]